MSTALVELTKKLASRLDMGDGTGLMDTLKATAFKGQVSDAQMTALMIVANQYGLNPWTKEIYAFPDKNNGIVPVVGVDGWSRIINTHPQFDGMDFDQNEDSCTCTIHRKDRGHPTAVTEYMVECKRDVGPWKSHPYRMLRHKALIQCARLAFGFVGIFDQDEAERIIEAIDSPKKIIHSPTHDESVIIPYDRYAIVEAVASAVVDLFNADDIVGSYGEYIGIVDSDEKVALWKLLPSNIRSALKKHGASLKEVPEAVAA